MRTQESTHNMKRHFVWFLTILALSGLLLVYPIGLAAGDAWTRKADMPTARYCLSTSAVDGIIYAIGGATGQYFNAVFPTVEAYNPATDTWTTKTDMPTPRAFHAASVVDGIIYVIGGTIGNTTLGSQTVEAYDPVTDIWTKKADMPTARFALSASAVNGQIYAIGGTRGGPWEELSTVEVYDPATDTWTAKTDMPTARSLLATSVLEGQIYAIGGCQISNNYNGMSTVEAYDPITDNWASKAEMPTGRMVLSTCAVDGIIYAIAGSLGPGETKGSPGVSTVEAYDPVTNTWAAKADMPTPRGAMSTSVVNGRVYAIGGSEFWYGVGTGGEDYPTVEEYYPGGLVAAVSPQGKVTATWGMIKAQ